MTGRAQRPIRAEAFSTMTTMTSWAQVSPAAHAFGEEVFPGAGGPFMADESDRTRLIGDISRLIRAPETPESARTAGLELIGWLARRMPGESAHAVGVDEARESQRLFRAARRKSR
jgi:hypothetical protein